MRHILLFTILSGLFACQKEPIDQRVNPTSNANNINDNSGNTTVPKTYELTFRDEITGLPVPGLTVVFATEYVALSDTVQYFVATTDNKGIITLKETFRYDLVLFTRWGGMGEDRFRYDNDQYYLVANRLKLGEIRDLPWVGGRVESVKDLDEPREIRQGILGMDITVPRAAEIRIQFQQRFPYTSQYSPGAVNFWAQVSPQGPGYFDRSYAGMVFRQLSGTISKDLVSGTRILKVQHGIVYKLHWSVVDVQWTGSYDIDGETVQLKGGDIILPAADYKSPVLINLDL